MKQTVKDILKKTRTILFSIFNKHNPNLAYIITGGIAFIIVVIGMNMFIELTEELKTDSIAYYDQKIADFIISYRTPFLTDFFTYFTHLGDLYAYLILLFCFGLLAYFILKKRRYVIQITSVILLASISNRMLKRFINRARPDAEQLVSVTSLSYPSGHSMSAMAFYGFLIYLVYNFKMNRILKISLIVLLIFIILGVGISRVYLGVHFPSDVAGGYLAGLIWIFFCVLIFNLIEIYRKKNK